MILSTDLSAPGICLLSPVLPENFQTPAAKVNPHSDAAIWSASAMDRSPSRVLIRNAISSVSSLDPFKANRFAEVSDTARFPPARSNICCRTVLGHQSTSIAGIEDMDKASGHAEANLLPYFDRRHPCHRNPKRALTMGYCQMGLGSHRLDQGHLPPQ